MTMAPKTKQKLIGIFALLIGPAVAYAGIKEMGDAGRLKAEGVEVPGRVVDGKVKTGRRNSKTYYLTVQYDAQGGSAQQKEFQVSKSSFDRAEADPQVTVRHLPTDPSVAAITGEEKTGMVPLLIGVGVALFGAFMTFLGFKKEAPAAVT